jgi:hypothetical protein
MTYPHPSHPPVARAPVVLNLNNMDSSRHHDLLHTPDYGGHKADTAYRGWAASCLSEQKAVVKEVAGANASILDSSIEVVAEVSEVHPAVDPRKPSSSYDDEVVDEDEPMIVSEEEDDELGDDYDEGDDDEHDDEYEHEEEAEEEAEGEAEGDGYESRKKDDEEAVVHLLETESESEVLSVDVPLPAFPPPAAGTLSADQADGSSGPLIPPPESADVVVPPLESDTVSSESLSSSMVCEKAEEAAVDDGGAGDDGNNEDKLVEDSAKDAGNSNSSSPVADGEHISSSAVAQVVEESQ